MSADPIRIPCRFRVASLRPWMLSDPRAVTVTQSPCRHTGSSTRSPSHSCSKYAARYRDPSSSSQKPTGIDGIGAVITISPTSSTSARPSGDQLCRATPRYRTESSPGTTGMPTEPPANAVTTSVPPLTEETVTWAPTASGIHSKRSAANVDPVLPTVRSSDRSWASPGRSPAFRDAWI